MQGETEGHQPGEYVWVKTEKKGKERFYGPFQVVEKIGNHCYSLKNDQGELITRNGRMLKKCHYESELRGEKNDAGTSVWSRQESKKGSERFRKKETQNNISRRYPRRLRTQARRYGF